MTEQTNHSGVRETLGNAKDKASESVGHAKARAGDALDKGREQASNAAHQAADVIEGNPLAVVLGGVAVGALVAALLPRSAREKELLAPIGAQLGAAALAAFAAAKDAGKGELDNQGLSRDAAKDQMRSLFDGLLKAAGTAGSAAAQAGRDSVRSKSSEPSDKSDPSAPGIDTTKAAPGTTAGY